MKMMMLNEIRVKYILNIFFKMMLLNICVSLST